MADSKTSVIASQTKEMATVATQRPGYGLPRSACTPMIRVSTEPVATLKRVYVPSPKFDPEKHLAFREPSQILMMKDIGYTDDVGVSPVAVTHPFQLFSPEAIQIMRSEIFNPAVKESCRFESNIAANQLRGYARQYAPFTYQAWNHPQTIEIVSKLAGVDLVPWGDYEIAHINLSTKSDEQLKEERRIIFRQKQQHIEDEGIGGFPGQDNKPIVGWHTDSYPFVCVLMMSDCTNMVGGETALRTASGEVIKVRGPTEGCAVILQGRYIVHQGMRALGAKERITAVTSYRPRSPFVKDDTAMRTVRPVSDLSELYYDFAEYRLEIVEEHIRKARKDLAARRRGLTRFDNPGHKAFLRETIAFLEKTDRELVDENQVPKGYIEEEHYPNAKVVEL